MLKFLRKDDGLVTVEWVGISAVMILAAIGITVFVMQGSDTAGGKINAGMSSLDPTPSIGTFGDGISAN